MRKPTPRLAACVGGFVVVVCSACGGGGGDPPFSTPTPGTPSLAATSTALPSPSPSPTVSLSTLDDARAALRAGSYDEAAAAFDGLAAAATDPQVEAEARLGASVARYQSGNLQGAIDDLQAAFTVAVGTPSELRVGYLYGLRLVEAGNGSLAAGVLGGLAPGPGDVLSPYIRAALANALVLTGDLDGATASWDAALADPQANDAVKLAIYRDRADLALSQGDNTAAADWLRLSTALRATSEDRYELAGLASSFGDVDTFAAQLSAIMSEDPGSRYAEMAIDDLTAAGFVVDQGLAGYVYYRRREYETARAWLNDAVVEPGISTQDLVFRTYYLAASYDDDGYYADAVFIYDGIEALSPASPYVHRAKYWAARATEAQGLTEEAAQRYVALAQGPEGEFSEEARFRAGFVLYEGGDPQGALTNWDYLNPASDGRLLYWRGRALEALDSPMAEDVFRQASQRDPVSFYGQAAAIRLGLAETPGASYDDVATPGPIDWNVIAMWLVPGAMAPPAVKSAAIDLADVGLTSLAGDLLAQEVDGQGLSPLAELGYIRAAHDAGLTDLAARWATQLAGTSTVVPEDLARLAYPLDYVELLSEAGKEQNVDPLFLAALIRQESFWDPMALSVANAYGLTQVVPSTGESIASTLGFADFEATDLWRPAVSIEFGAYYIGAQLKTFGAPQVALAAYNGGPGHAGTWAELAASQDPADFVEAVSFTETQGYIVRVMENYARYIDLYR